MRYLLDTNIITNVTKPVPSEALLEWMANQQDDDLFIPSLSVGEIQRGILEKPAGKKRRELEAWFMGPEGTSCPLSRKSACFRRKSSSCMGAPYVRGCDNGQTEERANHGDCGYR
jgi:toxin FitB